MHMSTVTEIGEAIRKLPPQEAWKLATDLREYLDSLWDKPVASQENRTEGMFSARFVAS
jgi:hypothetical protein